MNNNTKLYIVPIIVDIINGKYFTLVIDNPDNPEAISLPFVYNDYLNDVNLQVKDCITKYIKVNPDWLKINLLNKVRNQNNSLEIFFYFSIPYDKISIIDKDKSALVNFDLICMNDPFLCNLKYYI